MALSLEGAEEGSHMGATDFRMGGRIFATLASEKQGYGNLMLTPEQQAAFVGEMPEVFVPIAGGWGRMGMTHIRLAAASEDVLAGALRTAWKLRVERTRKRVSKRNARRRRRCEELKLAARSDEELLLGGAASNILNRRLAVFQEVFPDGFSHIAFG